MQCVSASTSTCVEDAFEQQARLNGWPRPDADRFIRLMDVRRAAISFAVNRDGAIPERLRAANHAAGDLSSGDTGRFDERGNLHVIGRLNDTFKTSKGKLVVPAPLELSIASWPGVDQARFTCFIQAFQITVRGSACGLWGRHG